MDGLEWKRSKYNKYVQQFLRHAERWAVKYSDYLVADSKGIQDYVLSKYNAESVFVAYGADIYRQTRADHVLAGYQLSSGAYDLVIARFESENSIELILKAYQAMPDRTLVLIGRHDATAFGRKMYKKFTGLKNIIFLGGVFEKDKLNAIRCHSDIYYHGHSVGGTNPSLLEAMACGAVICAHDNEFNRSVLHRNAFYFKDISDIISNIQKYKGKAYAKEWTDNNLAAIENEYNWDNITGKLEDYFMKWLRG